MASIHLNPAHTENLKRKNALTMILMQIGQVDKEENDGTKSMPIRPRSLGGGGGGGEEDVGGGGGGGEEDVPIQKENVPKCLYGCSTAHLADVMAQLNWALKDQDGNELAFTLDTASLKAFPGRIISQSVNLNNPNAKIDGKLHYTSTTVLTPEFVGKDLTLDSTLGNVLDYNNPELARKLQNYDKPKITFMLLPIDQFERMQAKGDLFNVIKAQVALNLPMGDGDDGWSLQADDQYWLSLMSTEQLLKRKSWAGEPTFRFEGEVVAAEPIKPGEKSFLRIKRETVVAQGGQSNTFVYCANPDNRQVLPLHNGDETQLWLHCFEVLLAPNEVRTVYNVTDECPICLQSKQQFCVLTCGHGVCATCKDDVADARKNVRCPVCRDHSSASNIVTVDIVDLTGD
jgi:hypothetical protein